MHNIEDNVPPEKTALKTLNDVLEVDINAVGAS